jgi:hypothetical protein
MIFSTSLPYLDKPRVAQATNEINISQSHQNNEVQQEKQLNSFIKIAPEM